MKRMSTSGIIAALCIFGSVQAYAQDQRVTLGAVAGTTGIGADLAWRFHDRLGISARYTDGVKWSDDYRTDYIDYDGDVNFAASKLTLDYYPFAGGFFLSAGLMLPDIEADVVGTPRALQLNGQELPVDQLGTLHGTATIADGVQPYVGMGWRKSHRSGFGVFAEVGVIPTDVEVSLSTSEGYENGNNPASAQLRQWIREEERELKDEAEKWPVYPVATLGVTYTF